MDENKLVREAIVAARLRNALRCRAIIVDNPNAGCFNSAASFERSVDRLAASDKRFFEMDAYGLLMCMRFVQTIVKAERGIGWRLSRARQFIGDDWPILFGLISAQSARRDGATHEGSAFGIPVWIEEPYSWSPRSYAKFWPATPLLNFLSRRYCGRQLGRRIPLRVRGPILGKLAAGR